MTRTQKIINLTLKLNGAIAGTLCIGSVLFCAGNTIALFATAPFVSDQTEYQVSRPILPAAAGIVVGLGWATITGFAFARWHNEEETNRERRDRLEAEARQRTEQRHYDRQQQQAWQEALPALAQWNADLEQEQHQSIPIACWGCRHYHGYSYNGTVLVCGMYPYGWDDKEEKCPDWRSTAGEQEQAD